MKAAPIVDPPPIRWLHLPKAGQSFFVTICLYGCRNRSLVSEVHDFLRRHRNSTRRLQKVVRHLGLAADSLKCPYLQAPLIVGHSALQRAELGHVVGLFRSPRQRMLSFCASSRGVTTRTAFLACVAASAKSHLGVAAHQVGGNLSIGNNARPYPDPSSGAVHEAMRRMITGFAFIGLQEEWMWSVRLFHTMLLPDSVPMVQAETANLHATRDSANARTLLAGNKPSWQQMLAQCDQGYGEGVLEQLPMYLRGRLALDGDLLVYAFARLVFCARMDAVMSTRPAACKRTCPIAYVSERVSRRGQLDGRLSLAARALLRTWGLHTSRVASLLEASLRGDDLLNLRVSMEDLQPPR